MNADALFAEFVRRLAMDDWTLAELHPGEPVTILEAAGVQLVPPVRFHVDPASLAARLRAMPEANEVFPTVAPEIAAMQLLLVHVDETIATRRSGNVDLHVNESGLAW